MREFFARFSLCAQGFGNVLSLFFFCLKRFFQSIVEALSNAYLMKLPVEEGLFGPDVLLMVLRTYLRNFVEPIFTLHLSKVLLGSSGGSHMTEVHRSAMLRKLTFLLLCCWKC
jgi:hypothetical protein